jgi:N,N'-diacetyllegionaminate synthase
VTQLIAETAWHHEGDYGFLAELISKLCEESRADVIKMHVTLDLDSYMSSKHEAYETLRKWMLSEADWQKLFSIVRKSEKKLMLLLNDVKAIEFSAEFSPDYVELHSVCLNVPKLQECLLANNGRAIPIVIGVGGCTLEEVDSAMSVFDDRETVLMFGFQNYPTKYEDVNLRKIRKIQSLYPGNKCGYADHTGWDEPNNELITLLVSSNGMDYVEKHVTTEYGIKRCDYSAAISIDMLNMLAANLRVLDRLKGNGEMDLNEGEQTYSQYGPMKMAAVATADLDVGVALSKNDFEFTRTAVITKLSQIDVIKNLGKPIQSSVKKGQALDRFHFEGCE